MVTRQQKEQSVSDLRDRAQGATVALVANYAGLSMEQLKACRKAIKGTAKAVVVKNTLAKIALSNTDLEPISAFMTGPSLLFIGYSEASEAIKQVNDFQKSIAPLLVIKGGVLDGQALNAEEVDAISKLPSKEVILAQIAGALTSTPTTMVNAINQIIGDIGELAVKVAEKNQ